MRTITKEIIEQKAEKAALDHFLSDYASEISIGTLQGTDDFTPCEAYEDLPFNVLKDEMQSFKTSFINMVYETINYKGER